MALPQWQISRTLGPAASLALVSVLSVACAKSTPVPRVGAVTSTASEARSPSAATYLPKVHAARHSLGPLALGLTEVEILQILGQPDEQLQDVEEAATGNVVTGWVYSKLGLTLTLARGEPAQPRTLDRFTATAPCTFTTNRGIRIGSKLGALDAAYATDYAKDGQDDAEDAPSGGDTPTPAPAPAPAPAEDSAEIGSRVVDSVYGGVVFTLENQAVAEIFFGAAAE